MRMHWVGFSYSEADGYGRYSNRNILCLQHFGLKILPLTTEHAVMPGWMKSQLGITPNTFTISCVPPYLLGESPSGGHHWLLSMTEGSELPDYWAEAINNSDVERVIVPCEWNAQAFRDGGVRAPVHVIPGGTDPQEFPVIAERSDRPYTFLALGDRGGRKGWTEVYSAFQRHFDGVSDVRLVIKTRPKSNELIDAMARATDLDPRITIMTEDVDMPTLFAAVDCFAIPSRGEGWGMPHREAAMSGLPVITQAYGGMDDGHTSEWAIVIDGGILERIPDRLKHIKGEWLGANVNNLAEAMLWCYHNPDEARQKGMQAAQWLRANQTWGQSAAALLALIQEYA